MKKLVISEDQFGRMFKHTISEQSEGGWVQMDDEEKREYLQQFTSDGEKIEMEGDVGELQRSLKIIRSRMS